MTDAVEVCEIRLLLTDLTGNASPDIGLDIDQNRDADAKTDGVLVLRWLAGFTDDVLVKGATDISGKRSASEEIEQYISGRMTDFDIDENGQADPLSDGILIMRYLEGYTGDALTDGVVDSTGERTNPGLVSGQLGWLGRDLPPVPSFNNDDFADIVGVRNNSLWLAASDGTEFTTAAWGAWDSNADWLNVNVGDFNGDGLQDFAGRNETGDWEVGLSDGEKFEVSNWGHWSPDTSWETVTTADVNGDGHTDIIGNSNGDLSVALSMGDSFVTQTWGHWPIGQRWNDFSTGDLNTDGKDDLLGLMDDGTWWSAISKEGKFETAPWVTWPNSASLSGNLTGDFNGDGRMDVMGLNSSSLNVGLAKPDSSGSLPQKWGQGPAGAKWDDVNVLDVNGDGRDDVAGRIGNQLWTGVSTGNEFVVQPWGQPLDPSGASANWHDVSVADVNGDGRDDLVGRVNGEWTAAVSKGSDFALQQFGSWESDSWSYVKSSRQTDDDLISNLAATGFTPGTISTVVNGQLVELIDELHEEIVDLGSSAEGLVDVTQTLEDLQSMRQSLQENQQLIQPVIDGTVDHITLGPETEINRVTLAESDRLIWDTMLDGTGQSSSGGGLNTVEDVQKLGEAFYSQLVNDTISGTREAVGRLSDILSTVSGHFSAVVQGVTAMTLAGISAALESGKVIINDGKATPESYAQTTDILLEYVANSELLQGQIEDEISDYLDKEYWQLLNWAMSVGNQFDTTKPGTLGNQIKNNFQQIQLNSGVSATKSILGTWTGEYNIGFGAGTITLSITTSGAYVQSGGNIRGSGQSNATTAPGDTSLTGSFSGYFTYHGCNCSLDPNPTNSIGLSVELNSAGELVGSFDATPVRLRR